MYKDITFAKRVLQFYEKLEQETVNLPEGFKIINPYKGKNKDVVKKIANIFYGKYYNDNNTRRFILGSSPARRGSAITGIPFEDSVHLKKVTGIDIEKFNINKSSSSFLNEVISKYGGSRKFYLDYYMNFVCPLGITRINSKGKEINCNYYENKRLKDVLQSFIISSLEEQIAFGMDTSVCYCIGSGENYDFLTEINASKHYFDNIVPLEHPRYIMQYNLEQKEFYIEKYMKALSK